MAVHWFRFLRILFLRPEFYFSSHSGEMTIALALFLHTAKKILGHPDVKGEPGVLYNILAV